MDMGACKWTFPLGSFLSILIIIYMGTTVTKIFQNIRQLYNNMWSSSNLYHFPIYFPNSNYCYQVLRYPSRDVCLHKSRVRVFLYIDPQDMTHSNLEQLTLIWQQKPHHMNLPHSNDAATGTIHQKELSSAHEHRETAPPGKGESFSICLLDTYSVTGPELGTCEHTWRKEAVLLSQSVDTATQGSGSC